MRVLVSQLYEDDGRPVPNWRQTVKPEYEGRFDLAEVYSKPLGRHTRRARLLALDTTGADLLPALEDAVVLYSRDGVTTVAGYERDELTRKESRQSWYMQELPSGRE